jgi:hypothetical protein
VNGLPYRLRPSLGMSCGPTAVCAVTGAEPALAQQAIYQAAAEDGDAARLRQHVFPVQSEGDVAPLPTFEVSSSFSFDIVSLAEWVGQCRYG